MANERGGVSGGGRRKGGGRFDDAGWNVVGDSKHPVGTINRPEGGRDVGGLFVGGGGGGGRFDVEDLVKLTPYAEPMARKPDPGSYEEFLPKDAPVHKWSQGKSITNRVEALDRPRSETDEQDHRKPGARRTYELSWEEYNKLSEDQRAAVDFNTLLVQAREKDLNADYAKATEQQRETYDRAVERMFGKEGGSETYAPETLAVLRQIDYQGGEGSDLDAFLGLKEAISANELKDFSIDPVEVSVNVPQVLPGLGGQRVEAEVLGAQQAAASGIAVLQEKLAKGNQLLADFRASAAQNRNADLQFFGGTANKTGPAQPGWGPGSGSDNPSDWNLDDVFHRAYENIAQRNGDVENTWGYLNEKLRPGELQAFMRYVDERSSQAQQYGLQLGDIKGAKYRTAEEFRKLLGLDKGD